METGSKQKDWLKPQLTGLTFALTGEMFKDPFTRPKYKDEPLTDDGLKEIIQREGGVIQEKVGPELNYLIRLGQNYPPNLRRQIDDSNYAGKTKIRQIGLIDFFEELLRPDQEAWLSLLRGGKKGVQRFSELTQYAPLPHMVDLSGEDLSDLDLNGAQLGYAKLKNTDFSNALLSDAQLSSADKVNFDGASLYQAKLMYLRDCSMVGTNLAKSSEGRFENSKLQGAYLNEAKINAIKACDLQNASLDEVDWPSHFEVQQSNFSGANLRNNWFSRADFRGADFSGANLSGSTIMISNLADADLTGASLVDCELGYCDLVGAKLEGANFTGAELRCVNLGDTDPDTVTGLRDALIAPRGHVGQAVQELLTLCQQSKRISFKGTAETDQRTIEFELNFDQRGARPPVWGEWQFKDKSSTKDIPDYLHILGGVDGSRYTKYLMDIAGFWTDAEIDWKSFKVYSSKAPLKGKELRDVVVAGVCEAWGCDPPEK